MGRPQALCWPLPVGIASGSRTCFVRVDSGHGVAFLVMYVCGPLLGVGPAPGGFVVVGCGSGARRSSAGGWGQPVGCGDASALVVLGLRVLWLSPLRVRASGARWPVGLLPDARAGVCMLLLLLLLLVHE